MKFHTVNGHLAVKTASFSEHVHSFHEVWHELSSLSDERDADVELTRKFTTSSRATPIRTLRCVTLRMPVPPTWLQAWRRFLLALAEVLLLRVMMQAVKLRIRPRAWLSHQDPIWMEEQNHLLSRAMSACEHATIQRSGNKHGRYSKCLTYGKKWKWDQDSEQWVDPPPKASRGPLPLPSSSTAATVLDRSIHQHCPQAL